MIWRNDIFALRAKITYRFRQKKPVLSTNFHANRLFETQLEETMIFHIRLL